MFSSGRLPIRRQKKPFFFQVTQQRIEAAVSGKDEILSFGMARQQAAEVVSNIKIQRVFAAAFHFEPLQPFAETLRGLNQFAGDILLSVTDENSHLKVV